MRALVHQKAARKPAARPFSNYLLVFLGTAPAAEAAKAAQSSLGEKRSTFAATNTS